MNTTSATQEHPKTFATIDAHTLMQQQFEPLQFAIEKILPHGLFIFAGSGKIGKSWLALDICRAVATGDTVWDFQAQHGEVLYLALEDNYRRLQDRLDKIGVSVSNSRECLSASSKDSSRNRSSEITGFHLTTASFGIGTGLLDQIHTFMATHTNVKLLVVDTLERIRDTAFDNSIYSCDYRDMMALREITDKYKLTLLLIHHTRKLHDSDPLNTLSGSMGLVGAADGVLVLQKEKRVGNNAILTIANRDTEEFCFALEFDRDNCKWIFKGNLNIDDEAQENFQAAKNEWLCLLVDEFLKDEWTGTATELAKALNEMDEDNSNISHLTIKRQLIANAELLLQNGIKVDDGRNSTSRKIILRRHEGRHENTNTQSTVTAETA